MPADTPALSLFETPDRDDEFAARYPEQVRALLASLRMSHLGGIFVAECDDFELRRKLFAYFRQRLADEGIYLFPFEVSDADLNLVRALRDLTERPGFKNLELVGRYRHLVIFVYGLEQYNEAQTARFLHLLNFLRDAFTLIEPPVVIWAPSAFVTQMARQTPDFWSWKGALFTFAAPAQAPEAVVAEPLPRPPFPPLARYLRAVLEDPEFFIWQDLYLPLQARRVMEPVKHAFVRGQLSSEELLTLAAHGTTRPFTAGEVLIQTGDRGDVAYAVTEGRLEVSLQSSKGVDIFRGQITPGGVCGEIGLVSDRARTATVRALSDGQAVVIGRAALARLEEEDPALAYVFRDLARKRLESLQQFTAPVRWFAAGNGVLFQQPPQDALAILGGSRRLALLGEAGAGKTTVLRRFMLDLARQAQADLLIPDAQLRVPIYIKLSLLDGQRQVEDLILDTLQHYGLYQVSGPGQVLSFLSDSGDARVQPPCFVFLLDGLNEMPANAAARRALRDFRHRFFDHRFIIACRTPDYTPMRGYQEANLQQLTPADMEAFLCRYLSAEKAQAILRDMQADPQLLELGQNPLALYMFTRIARTGQEALPRNRGVLFQRFTDNLLERTDTEWYRIFGRSKARVPLEVRRRALAELGLWMQEEDAQIVSRERCLAIFRSAAAGQHLTGPGDLSGVGVVRASAQDIFAECIHSSLIRLSPDRSQVDFLHPAVQEFWAAQGVLLRGADIALYLADPDERRRWAGVIASYFSIAPNKPCIWRAILHEGGDYFTIWLAAECLAAVGMEPDVLDQIHRSLEPAEVGPFLFAQGLAYRKRGRLSEALVCLREAAKLIPDSAYVHYDLGCLYRQMDQHPRAVESLKRAIKLDPYFVDAYNQLGITYYEQGRYVEALTAFRATVQLEPDNASHRYNLGHVHTMLRFYGEASEDFQRAVDLKPDYEEAQGQLEVLQRALDSGVLDVLGTIPLLRELTPEQLVTLASRLLVQDYAPGEVVLDRDEIGRALFIVESGEVAVLAPDPDGMEREVRTLTAGDFFGEMALPPDVPRTASAVARGPTRLLALSREDLDAIIRFPTVAGDLEETSSLLEDRPHGACEPAEKHGEGSIQ